ncbi:MAG: MFS transporter [Acidobacteriia bacterium]|nr:MFS transporter [Terriglobia bacterium]MYG04524.1 MFS transporter [Terriglobia bacterium]MYK10825.1 MFS transporter [Terriglobia bacterium]
MSLPSLRRRSGAPRNAPGCIRRESAEVASQVSLRGYAQLLRRSPNFRRVWIAQLISGSGDWFYSVAIYSMILELSGRAELVAWAAILQILPMMLLGPTAGAANDRLSRRKVMLVSDLFRAVLVLCMLLIDRQEELPWLYLLLTLEIGTAAFFEAGRSAILPSLIEREELPTANALGSTTWSLTVTMGAALGGVAVAYLGREFVFVANSATFLLSAWFVYRVRAFERHLAGLRKQSWLAALSFRPIAEGFLYMIRDWRLATLLTLKLGLGIMGARVVLTTILGSRDFSVGDSPALGMAVLFAFQGAGSTLGPLVMGRRFSKSQNSMRWTVLMGYLAAGCGYMLFSQTLLMPLAGLFLVLAHGGAALVWVCSTTLLHLNTENQFLGRVFAADMGLFMATASVSTYCMGQLLDAGLSARTGALGLGFAMLGPAALWVLSLRRSWD